jgi:S-sulfosulfanyl-L-cysteine sulfohydrolase
VEEMVNHKMQPHRDYLETVVGETKTALNRNTMLESTMDNLLLRSLIDLTGSDVAFSNGWRFGAPVPTGPVTMNDLYNIIPMNPPISTAVLTGKEIRQMMEENLERTFSRDPFQQMGGYVKRFLGMNVYFKIENPPGNRVQEVFVQGRRMQPEARYSAAFVTTQGVPEHFGIGKENLQIRAVEAMQRLLMKGSVHADLRGPAVAV